MVNRWRFWWSTVSGNPFVIMDRYVGHGLPIMHCPTNTSVTFCCGLRRFCRLCITGSSLLLFGRHATTSDGLAAWPQWPVQWRTGLLPLVLRRLDTGLFALLLLLGLFSLFIRRLLFPATTPLPFLSALSVLHVFVGYRGTTSVERGEFPGDVFSGVSVEGRALVLIVDVQFLELDSPAEARPFTGHRHGSSHVTRLGSVCLSVPHMWTIANDRTGNSQIVKIFRIIPKVWQTSTTYNLVKALFIRQLFLVGTSTIPHKNGSLCVRGINLASS